MNFSDPLLRRLYEQAHNVIRESELRDYLDQLASRLDFSIDIQTEDATDEEIPVGAHKIGGSPDVAPDFEWPIWNGEPLTFIAQFDLAALQPFDLKQLLPAQGMLSFFSMLRPLMYGSEPEDFLMHGIIGSAPETVRAWRVIHTPDSSILARRGLGVEYEPIMYAPQRISRVSTSICLPDLSEIAAEDGVWNTDDFYGGEIIDFYSQLREDLGGPDISWEPVSCSLLGYASYYQNDKREDASCFWNCDLSAMRLLAQFGSDDDMSFAGDGAGYFFIEKSELKAENFSRSYFGLQR